MKGIVYCYTNKINSKKYIGKTLNEKGRIKRHMRNSKFFKTPFYNAIRKYGWNNFEYSILYEEINNDKKYLDFKIKAKEKEYILNLNTIKEGYNLTEGGDGSAGFYPNEETRLKMSIKRKGSNHPNFGRISSQAKQVVKLSDSGEMVEEYFSIKEAALKNDAKIQHVSRCCKGIRNKTRGCIFKFKENFNLSV